MVSRREKHERNTAIEQFFYAAEHCSERIAVRWKESGKWESRTYAQLLQDARAIASYLKVHGVQGGDAVILPSIRDRSLCANILGILWAGGHYVFIDPEYPLERQKFICDAVGARIGIFEGSLNPLGHLEIDWHKIPAQYADGTAPELPSNSELAAYVMFTSGSTGKPKGVTVPNRAILRLVVDADFISFSEKEIFLQLSPLSFDASTLEIWGPLLNGGTCVLHFENGAITPEGMKESIDTQGVSTLWLTSSLFNTIVSENPETLVKVKQLLTGGEVLSVAHIRRALKMLPDTRLFNGYGPTENTTFTTVYSIPRTLPEDTKRIPIGYPIHGTACELFDKDLKPVTENGASGELIAFGDGLALGYLSDAKLTSEKFVEILCSDGQIRRGYRTGDLVMRNADGCYDFLQRNDEQVKIDGHRIEPREIEIFLNEMAEISEARVLVRVGPSGQKRLAAYVVGRQVIDRNDLRIKLGQAFPNYMIPHFIIALPAFPRNQNGKLDESQLPDPFVYSAEPVRDRNQVAACWEEILSRRVPETANFLDAGGTSLEALRLTSLLEKRFSVKLNPAFVFEYSTIKQQVAYFQGDSSVRADKSSFARAEGGGEFAVIGMACRFPGARNIGEYWQNLLDGKETISFFKDEELSDEIDPSERNHPLYVKAKGIVEDFDKFDAPFFGVSPIEAGIMDPQQRILLELTWHALEDAGIPPGDDKLRTGVFTGKNWSRYYQQYVLTNPDLIRRFGVLNTALANESDFLSTRISYRLNLTGPSISLYTACSTGLVTVAQACEAIERGQCEQAVAGCVSICTPVKSGYLYQEGGMLSKDGHCRPFDAAATGTTFNDGAGVVVIKRRDLAERDGDRIYAIIKGFAVNNDGEEKASFTAPSVGGQVAVYDAALQRAGIDPASVGFIETHGTATPLGDPIEVLSLRKAYAQSGVAEKTCALGSVKSNIGHTIHAAGAASLIKAILAVRHNAIPPTLFFETPNPRLELEKTPFFVNTSVVPWKIPGPRRAAVSSLGVGGTNAHVIVEEYQDHRPGADQETKQKGGSSASYSIVLSGNSEAALERQVDSYRQFFQAQSKDFSLADCAFTLATGRKHFAHRAAVSGRDAEEIAGRLSDRKSVASGKTFGHLDSKIGFIFSGQGAQRISMGQWLYEHDPDFREIFDLGCEVIQKNEGFDLRAALFADPTILENAAAVNQTRIAQPALFLLEYGVAQLLAKKGCRPDFLIGHSVGEFTAATIAGVFSFEDAIALVARRGALMQSMPPGKMLVVRTDLDKCQEYLNPDVCLAAANAPGLIVLAGPEAQIDDVKRRLAGNKIASTVLHTSHAFHSHMMEPIVAEFAACVAASPKKSPSMPIYSTRTGELLSPEEAADPSYWAGQMRHPVLFSKAVLKSLEDYSDCSPAYVEVGPGAMLSALVTSHPQLTNGLALASLPGSGIDEKALSELDTCIGRLWVKGFQIDWNAQFRGLAVKRMSLPGYRFALDSHWLESPKMPGLVRQTQSLEHTEQPIESIVQEVQVDTNEHYSEIKHQLKAVIEDVTGYDLDDIDEESQFSEVGLDSLLLTQIATAIEGKFEVGITFRHLVEEYTCLKDLTGFVADKIPPKKTAVAVVAVPAVAAATAPAIPSALSASAPRSFPIALAGNSVQDLLNAQLQIMQMQLQVLSGSGPSVAAAPQVVEDVPAVFAAAPAKTEPAVQSSAAPALADPQAAAPVRHSPGTRITREAAKSDLSNAQKEWIHDLLERYQKKFAGSKASTQKHRRTLADPRTVSGFNPEWKEIIFPIVVNRSKGSKLWDIDGNEFIDTSNGFGPIFFGHSPDFIRDAVKEQLDQGIETGPQSPLAGEVADLFCELTGNERCAFACTGSEAVIGALRLARTVTGRSKVVIFEGAYHGIYDEVIVRAGRNFQALPAAPGIPRDATSNTLVVPWGAAESLEAIKGFGRDIAAVMVESVQSRKPEFHSPEYIQALRDITAANGAALILDEVVTGFRVHPGGIRKRFGIDADLQTYGKVIGGGYPIGIIGGKAKYMDALDGGYWQYGDNSIPEIGVTFFAGTYVRHPLALVAAKAVLQKIKSEGMPLYERLEEKTAKMTKEAKAFVAEMEASVKFEEFASLFYVAAPDNAHWGHLLFTLMTLGGIHMQQYRPNFLTTEHSEADVQKILTTFKRSLAELIAHGLISGNEVMAKKYLSNNESIPSGARLGKNAEGQPAYFIEDANNRGKYIEVGRA